MKQFTSPFNACVELKEVGREVVVIRVDTSFRFGFHDHGYVCGLILKALLPDYILAKPLYDGSYVAFSLENSKYASNMCVPSTGTTINFDASVELEDGVVRDVHISLEHSVEFRRDYVIRDTRTIILRGVIGVSGDGDEESEN